MSASSAGVQGLAVRQLAAELLRQCIDEAITVEEAMNGNRQVAELSPRDRAMLSGLLLTAFRHRGEIGAILNGLLDRPLPRKSGLAAEILQIGVAQLACLDMPAHAVIDLAVRTAKGDRNAQHFSGLVNAVLRKVAAGGASLRDGLDGARLNTPSWLWERWSSFYGEEAARKIGLAHAMRPALDLSFREDATGWAGALGGFLLPNGQLRLPADHSPVPDLPGFAEGAWWVQDAAATFPVLLFGDLAGRTVLDLCAAPGGKTLQLAAAGAQVTAVDVSQARLSRLSANLARTGLAAEILKLDLLEDPLDGTWDAVLLDAPCSSTGTIRRHPELPWLKRPAQITELAGLQRRMLEKAGRLVRPGGLLVYCTCSLEPEEGEEQVRAFLAGGTPFEIVPARVPCLPEGAVRPEGWIRTMPFMQYGSARGLDGFFAAALRRLT